jgi:Tfp pilus assembly protein PilF
MEERGDHARAEFFLRRALKTEPASTLYHHRLAVVLQSEGKCKEAIAEYELVLANHPNDASVRNNIAWICATSPDAGVRNGARAIELLLPAAEKAGCEANLLDTLAAAYAEAGQFERAIETANQAIGKARNDGLPTAAVADMESRLALYKRHQPFHEK